MGHDKFAIVANTFVQHFPIYRPGDSNAASTRGVRRISYQLRRGKAGLSQMVDKVRTPALSR